MFVFIGWWLQFCCKHPGHQDKKTRMLTSLRYGHSCYTFKEKEANQQEQFIKTSHSLKNSRMPSLVSTWWSVPKCSYLGHTMWIPEDDTDLWRCETFLCKCVRLLFHIFRGEFQPRGNSTTVGEGGPGDTFSVGVKTTHCVCLLGWTWTYLENRNRSIFWPKVLNNAPAWKISAYFMPCFGGFHLLIEQKLMYFILQGAPKNPLRKWSGLNPNLNPPVKISDKHQISCPPHT